jgi:hypothetical protein
VVLHDFAKSRMESASPPWRALLSCTVVHPHVAAICPRSCPPDQRCPLDRTPAAFFIDLFPPLDVLKARPVLHHGGALQRTAAFLLEQSEDSKRCALSFIILRNLNDDQKGESARR